MSQYSKEYHLQDIDKLIDGIPYDDKGHALDVSELYAEGIKVDSIELATQARDLTNPYGAMSYGVGNDDYFIVFDYGIVDDGKIALHSVLNSEPGGFVQTDRYEIVDFASAVQVAKSILDDAMCALGENSIENDGWGDGGNQFVLDVKNVIRTRIEVIVDNVTYFVNLNYSGESEISNYNGKRINEEINGDMYYAILLKAKEKTYCM